MMIGKPATNPSASVVEPAFVINMSAAPIHSGTSSTKPNTWVIGLLIALLSDWYSA